MQTAVITLKLGRLWSGFRSVSQGAPNALKHRGEAGATRVGPRRTDPLLPRSPGPAQLCKAPGARWISSQTGHRGLGEKKQAVEKKQQSSNRDETFLLERAARAGTGMVP